MKIEIDISPDEVRQLFGLPDTSALQKLFVDRMTAWVEQQQGDADRAQQWINAMIQCGRQSFDAYQEFLKNFTRLTDPRRD